MELFKKKLGFERIYAAPIATVWNAWTQADMLREWWGPEKTMVFEHSRLTYEARSWTEGEEELLSKHAAEGS